MNNVLGQKMTSFDLSHLKSAVDEEVLEDMLKEHDLYLTLGGMRVTDLLYDNMVFFAMLKLADKVAPDAKHTKCLGRLTPKVKYSPKQEALYGLYKVRLKDDATKTLTIGVKCRYDPDTDSDPLIQEVAIGKCSKQADDIDLSGLVVFGEVTKTIVRVK